MSYVEIVIRLPMKKKNLVKISRIMKTKSKKAKKAKVKKYVAIQK